MGEGNKHSKDTVRFDSRKLVELTKRRDLGEPGSDTQAASNVPNPPTALNTLPEEAAEAAEPKASEENGGAAGSLPASRTK